MMINGNSTTVDYIAQCLREQKMKTDCLKHMTGQLTLQLTCKIKQTV